MLLAQRCTGKVFSAGTQQLTAVAGRQWSHQPGSRPHCPRAQAGPTPGVNEAQAGTTWPPSLGLLVKDFLTPLGAFKHLQECGLQQLQAGIAGVRVATHGPQGAQKD